MVGCAGYAPDENTEEKTASLWLPLELEPGASNSAKADVRVPEVLGCAQTIVGYRMLSRQPKCIRKSLPASVELCKQNATAIGAIPFAAAILAQYGFFMFALLSSKSAHAKPNPEAPSHV